MYKRLEGESDEELIYRICSEKDKIGSWNNVADILNNLLNTEYTESKFRKQYTAFQKMFDANREKFISEDTYIDELRRQQRELEKERIKLSTEKLEYNRWLRINARDELITEKIINAVKELEPLDVPEVIIPEESERTYCLAFGDAHYGTELNILNFFGKEVNAYSPEIFEARMEKMLNEVIGFVKNNDVGTLKVYDFGDGVDGILRVSQLWKLRYGVVDSAIKYGHYMASWLNRLSHYTFVEYQSVAGNHEELRELGQPKGTFTADNMRKVIDEIIVTENRDNPNFVKLSNDSGYIFDIVGGRVFVGIHGEVKNLEDVMKNFSKIYNVDIDYLAAGHLHHSRTEAVGIKSEIINIPSVIGVDDYALSLGKASDAGAKILVFDNNDGLKMDYRIVL